MWRGKKKSFMFHQQSILAVVSVQVRSEQFPSLLQWTKEIEENVPVIEVKWVVLCLSSVKVIKLCKLKKVLIQNIPIIDWNINAHGIACEELNDGDFGILFSKNCHQYQNPTLDLMLLSHLHIKPSCKIHERRFSWNEWNRGYPVAVTGFMGHWLKGRAKSFNKFTIMPPRLCNGLVDTVIAT